MTSPINVNRTNEVDQRDPAPAPAEEQSRELSYKDRQGLAMGWVFSSLAMFLLLAIVALGAAVILKVGFIGWLIGMAVMGLVIVMVIAAVNYFVLQPAR